MTATTREQQDQDRLFDELMDPARRADPYPLYARMRREPVSQQHDGTWLVSGHDQLSTLLHDPRVSSDERKSDPDTPGLASQGQKLVAQESATGAGPVRHPAFLLLDPPDHDRLRGAVMNHFNAERITALTGRVEQVVDQLVERLRSSLTGPRGAVVDLVETFSLPLPVEVICELLGVPVEDHDRFRTWSTDTAGNINPAVTRTAEDRAASRESIQQLNEYLAGLLQQRREDPRDDLLSAMVTTEEAGGVVSPAEVATTMVVLLVAGHETTVNLVTNAALAMLRDPALRARVADEPGLVDTFVEEMVRYDPPVQFRTRTTLAPIDLDGHRIPRGASLVLALAAGNRDPEHFPDADVVVPDRSPSSHLGFGGGMHYCVGAPLARLESRVAIMALARALEGAELVADPPPYRHNASLRGPAHLEVRLPGRG